MVFSVEQGKLLYSLYDEDYVSWLDETITAIREQQYSRVDWVNLLEELGDMGRSERNALESNLRVLLMHLLKYQYQPSKRSNSWLFSIVEHRLRIRKSLKQSPSLKGYLEQVWEEAYGDARRLAAAETGLDICEFPEVCLWNEQQILDDEFLPNG